MKNIKPKDLLITIHFTLKRLLLKVDSQFTFEYRGEIPVKGKGKIEMCFVSVNN
ncbi:MAG: hypothetical protein JJU02_01310 [Cryomorphaceae bacterium]|nr:hypothetical protein [Cryomorphaceae bacterium]